MDRKVLRTSNLSAFKPAFTPVLQKYAFENTQVWKLNLRLPYTIKSPIFFKFRFFGLSNDPDEISNVKKKSLKKIKYWQLNGGFKFWPEVKIIRLLDTFSAVFLKRTL